MTGSLARTSRRTISCTSPGRALRVGVWVGIVLMLLYTTTALIVPARDDEAIFADPAQSLVSGRGLASPVLDGLVPGAETALVWQPPGYYVALAAQFQLTGAGLLAGRLLSVVTVVVALLLLFALLHRRFGVGAAATAVLLTGVTPWVQQAATTIRPEGVVTLLCVLAIVVLGRPWPGHVQGLLVGMVSGLALVMHPLGAMVGLIATIDLFRRREWRAFGVFVLLAVLVVSLVWLPVFLAHTSLVLEQWTLQGERKGGLHVLALVQSVRRLPGYAPLLVATVMVLALARSKLSEVRAPEWTWLAVAIIAGTIGAEEQYPVYIAIAGIPLIALAMREAANRWIRWRVGLAVALITIVAAAPTVWFAVSDTLRLGGGSTLVEAVGNRQVFLGPGAAGIYFDLAPAQVRVFSPTPVSPGRTVEEARAQGLVVADFTRSGDSELVLLARCPVVGLSGALTMVRTTGC